jgi:hypothetical protein
MSSEDWCDIVGLPRGASIPFRRVALHTEEFIISLEHGRYHRSAPLLLADTQGAKGIRY